MKIIDLLNKIANGELEEYDRFEYNHHNGCIEYVSARQFFDRYIVDKENLNLEVKLEVIEDSRDMNFYD